MVLILAYRQLMEAVPQLKSGKFSSIFIKVSFLNQVGEVICYKYLFSNKATSKTKLCSSHIETNYYNSVLMNVNFFLLREN